MHRCLSRAELLSRRFGAARTSPHRTMAAGAIRINSFQDVKDQLSSSGSGFEKPLRAENLIPQILLKFSTLEKLDVVSGAKVPWGHGAEAPSEPPVAGCYFQNTFLAASAPPVLNNGLRRQKSLRTSFANIGAMMAKSA